MKAVEVNNLSFKYPDSKECIFENISFSLDPGESLAVLGPSGCGKSTLCLCISGLIPRVYPGNLSGQVLIYGQNIRDLSLAQTVSKLGIIFQNPATQLFSPTIEDELAFGPENLCLDREEIGLRIEKILKTINMESYRFDNPNSLSGGQQQLIAIASVLMLNPEIIICDEIMSWIDDEGKEIIKKVLESLKEEGKTIIMVDHDRENIKLADRVIYIGGR